VRSVKPQPAVKERFGGVGVERVSMDPRAFRKLFADEDTVLSSLIRNRKIGAE